MSSCFYADFGSGLSSHPAQKLFPVVIAQLSPAMPGAGSSMHIAVMVVVTSLGSDELLSAFLELEATLL
jgi:hypothetical protein